MKKLMKDMKFDEEDLKKFDDLPNIQNFKK